MAESEIPRIEPHARKAAHRAFWIACDEPVKARIDCAIRAYIETSTPGRIERIAEVLMSHPLVDAPAEMRENFITLAEAVDAAIRQDNPNET